MSTFLFNEVVFGPVRSRRLGLSLGINLLPNDYKYCTFNCIYCECGWTKHTPDAVAELPSRKEVREYLEIKLKSMVEEGYLPDALTFAGNGEPTIHPAFPDIVKDTIGLRNKYVPGARITVLSNASRIHKPAIFDALLLLDNNIQKLDAGSQDIFNLINNPVSPVRLEKLISDLQKFDGKVIIQSMFLKGKFKDQIVDNTAEANLSVWLEQIARIRPSQVMVYSISRSTPLHGLEIIPGSDLERIAGMVKGLGIDATIY